MHSINLSCVWNSVGNKYETENNPIPTTRALIIVPNIAYAIIGMKLEKKNRLFMLYPDSKMIGGSKNKKKYSGLNETAFSSLSEFIKKAKQPTIPPSTMKAVDSWRYLVLNCFINKAIKYPPTTNAIKNKYKNESNSSFSPT